MLLSASVNSISSIPSPVYQCKKAFLRNMAVNCSLTLRNISWIEVEFPMNVDAIFRPVGGMSHTVDFTLLGIHSTKARYCCDPRDVSGANPTMKKCNRGNGIRFTASLRRSELSCPGKRKQQVTPLMVAEINVVSLGPIVTGAGLAKDEVIGPEDLPVRPRSDAIHGSRLEVHEHGARNEPPAAGLIVVDVHALQLEVVVAAVSPGGVDAVLGANHVPELCSDLVAALASLNVQNLTHPCCFREK
nr:protein TUB21 [Ipomoea batatas]